MRDRTLVAFGFTGVVALAVSTAALVAVLLRPGPSAPKAEPALARPSTEARPATAAAPEASVWRSAPTGLSKAVDVAFFAGASLSTDGKQATFDSGDGSSRPVEVPAAIPRVFAASGRLFAVGENQGAPFAIVLASGEEPLVVPMPCAVMRMAGENGVVAGLCADGSGLALSADAGRSFRPVPIELPAPANSQDVEVDKRLEAVAVSPAGAIALAAAQRWQSETPGGVLAWTWGQVVFRPAGSRALRTSNVQALAHTVGMHLSGGALTLAGLEVAFGGVAEGEVHPRLFRGAEGEPPVAVGTAGPSCGTVAGAREVQGLLMGTQVAFFACGQRLVSTLDGGASWSVDPSIGAVDVLRGGDMRVFARGEGKTWERRFVDRAESGATAVRVPGAVLVRKERDGGVEQGPVSAAFGIREPADAGSAPDATGDDAATP